MRKIEDEYSHLKSGFARWKSRNRDSYNASERKRRENFKRNNPTGTILKRLRQRAKQHNLEFTLKKEDIVIPEYCPVLGLKLEVGSKKGTNPNAPSIDRFDNTKGYTKDNIRVISWRANTLKRDATIEEFEKVLEYMKGNI